MTDAEGKAFWPIYDAYQADLQKINERLKAGIDSYAKEYNAGSMTDAKASALTTEVIAIEEALVALKKTYVAKLAGVIPAGQDRALHPGREQGPRPDQLRAGGRHPVRALARVVCGPSRGHRQSC